MISVASSSAPIVSSAAASSSAPALFIDAGPDMTIRAGEVVNLQAQSNSNSAITWQQTSGPDVRWLAGGSSFIAAGVNQTTALTFRASNAAGSDTLTATVEPCQQDSEMLFGDCLAPLTGGFLAYESSERQGQLFHYENTGDFHVQWQWVDSGDGDHGRVLEVNWNANDPNNSETARGWFGLAMAGLGATEGADLSRYANGALSFDMRLAYHEQPSTAAPFIAKIECIHPCASSEIPLAGAHQSFEWQTYTLPIAQLIASGLDIDRVNHVFVIQPDWFNQQQRLTIQLDNIRLTPEYTAPGNEGCPANGAVSYTLNQAANPTADQREAYALITTAMDAAVQNYNCYTNLARHLTVQYNPDVATADGSTNGNIRFGSRASMHPVTAMHEIAHTFGAGGAASFRALVVDGIFTGPIATAKVREIAGNNTEQLKSDGTHFWPHGLNYIHEGGTQQDLINHCLMVEAIYQDIR